MTPFVTETVIDNVERYLAQKYADRPPVEPPPVLQSHDREFAAMVLAGSMVLGALIALVMR
jgi:hypothetical protein